MSDGEAGARGGIYISLAVPPTVPSEIFEEIYPVQNGVPAAKIHDNIVSQPLGQALALGALGPVSVLDNQFTSRGVLLRTNPISLSFIASTVFIINLGVSNELYGQIWTFSGLTGTQLATGAGATDEAIIVPGLDDAHLGRYLANGNVLFADNQVSLDLMETGVGFALSSIMIFSLDDIGFHANQCDCNLLDDFLFTQAVLFGFSVRVSDNRFKEGVINALFSAMTAGLLNATTNNQATHCLLILGFIPALKVDAGNRIVFNAFISGYCERAQGGLLAGGFSRGLYA
jgi:hypothetical protein